MPIQVEIVSPEKILLSKNVDMAVVPSVEGDLAAMEQHAPVIVLLRGGLVSLFEGDTVTDRLFVAGGFAEITADRCTVLADDAVAPGDIDRAEADRLLHEAEEEWNRVDMTDLEAVPRAASRLQVAQSRVDAANDGGTGAPASDLAQRARPDRPT